MASAVALKLISDTEPPRSPHRLHEELDQLHELIYRRGGVSPVNAAIEELSKLLLLEVKLLRDPAYEVPGLGGLSMILDPENIVGDEDITKVRQAFQHVASLVE